MTAYSIDANVFFRVFKSETPIIEYLESLKVAVDLTVYIECIQGSKSNEEKRKIENYLDNFPLVLISKDSSMLALELIRKYSNSNGLLLGDALIAANALKNDLTLVTFNLDDFKFIDGLRVVRPEI